jgi:Icc-related predicted phosphoesterase
MSRVINAHNELVRRCIQHAQLVCDDPPELVEFLDADGIAVGSRRQKSPRYSMWGLFSHASAVQSNSITKVEKEQIRNYVKLILGFANGMAMWMAVSKRYAA